MQTKTIIRCAALLVCLAAIHHRAAAQFFGVRVNALAALTGTVAVGAEAALTDNWTVETSAYWNPIRTERLTTQVGAVQLGVRHWFYEDFVGHFLGLHASWVDYRIGNRRRTYDAPRSGHERLGRPLYPPRAALDARTVETGSLLQLPVLICYSVTFYP